MSGPTDPPHRAGRRGVYPRGQLEFDRVAFFSDAVYAIAMTLLIVAVEVPDLRDGSSGAALREALGDKIPEFVSFAVGFFLIGRYWIAHHTFFSLLDRVDRTLMGVNTVYLGFVAWLPFPTGLIGEYEGNLVAFALFMGSLAVVSGMETVLLVLAHRRRLMRVELTAVELRWGTVGSLAPVAVFAVAILVAAATTTTWGLLALLLNVPIGVALSRRAPEGARDLFG